MKKILYTASVVLLGAGLGVAQCMSGTATQTSSTNVNETRDTSTPSAYNPQTYSPDSINRWNPVSGQNPDSQRNPNALSMSSSVGASKTVQGAAVKANSQTKTTTTSAELGD